MEAEEFRGEIRQLLNDMPMSVAGMNEKQMLACILYLLYELKKGMKHVDFQVNSMKIKLDFPPKKKK